MERTIKVTGRGKLSVKPDMIRLVMELEGRFEDYGETLQESSRRTDEIKDIFEGLGFDRSDVRTTAFNINTEYENYQDKDNSWKRRFAGYKFNHGLKVEFDIDNRRLGRIVYALAHSNACPVFHICYTVRDAAGARDRLLQSALQDSVRKAQLLSSGAGVKLGDIVSIDYSIDEQDIISKPVSRMYERAAGAEPLAASDSYDLNMDPEDIDLSDTLTVIWSID